jgi:hypothetical protein
MRLAKEASMNLLGRRLFSIAAFDGGKESRLGLGQPLNYTYVYTTKGPSDLIRSIH